MEYTVVDIETTGLSELRHAITEIAAVRMRDGKPVEKFHTLVNPGVAIPAFITKLTGIDNAMVQHAPPINEVIEPFVHFLGDSVFVAHNASFDFRFLNYNALRYCNRPLPVKKLCTRKLANRLVPHLPTKKLECICNYFAIQNDQAHRAMADVHATIAVLDKFMSILKEKDITNVDDVLKFECMPARKCLALLNQ